MTILMLVHVIAPSGGIEAALVDLAQALVQTGNKVIVYACRPFTWPNQNVARLQNVGVELSACPGWVAALAGADEASRLAVVERLLRLLTPLLVPVAVVDAWLRGRSWRKSLDGLNGRWRGWLVPRLACEWLYYLPLELRLYAFRPRVVHVHGWGCGIDPPGALKWTSRHDFAVVYTEHNSPPPLEDGVSRPPSWLNLADLVIACSNAGSIGLRDVCCANNPIRVIPYSVADPTLDGSYYDHGTTTDSGRPVTITCLARLAVRHKGQDNLLWAMKKLLAVAPETRLLLAGEGESRAALEILADDLGIGDRVTFLGNVPRSQLSWLMAESDVMVLPSNWEGLPVSIIESMAFAKPVVASDVGGNPELVADGKSGFVVPARDVDALVGALVRLVADPALRARMGAEARRRFEAGGFSPIAVAEATVQAYDLASSRAPATRWPP